MGSYSSSKSTNIATDNRLAVTDSAFGLSSSGSNNNVALDGHIFNVNQSAGASGFGGSNKAGSTGGIQFNLLDGGAIDKSLDFAAFSLSQMLENIINQGQQQQQTVEYTMDTIGQAIQSASTIQAKAAEAVTGDNQEFIKKAAFVAVAGVVAWWVWKGKK